ncbi:MAG: hypothetical protein IPK99_06860 [Flavobacteriales bacterium]|nr:hypothetical protein [Flavobacteriales bacterium]
MRTVLLFLASALLAPCAVAQSLKPTEKETAYILLNDSLVGGLVLDTIQRGQLAEGERRYQLSYDAVLANDTLGEDAVRMRLQELATRRDAEIQRVMTKDQYAEWKRITREGQGDRKEP